MKKFLAVLLALVLALWPTAVLANAGNALDFDGVNDYVSVADTAALNFGGDFTVELWVNPSSIGSQRAIIDKDTISGTTHPYTSELQVEILSDGKIRFLVGSTTTWSWSQVSSTTQLSANNWYHVAAVMDSTTMRLYINGVNENTTTNSLGRRADTGLPLSIGRSTDSDGVGTSYFHGKIDELRIWNIARTQTQIQNNKNRTLVGDEANLIAYYNFNQSATTTLDDLTSNNLDGILTNMDAVTDWVSSTAPIDITVGVPVYPPDKLALLAPWLVLIVIAVLAVGGGILALTRRRAH